MENQISTWKGSAATFCMVAHQIKDRWGMEAVKEYDPNENCFTYKTWRVKGFQVQKGEKALESITWISTTKTDKVTGEEKVSGRYPKTVYLFFKNQVKPIQGGN